VRLADGYASTNRTDANTNIVRKRGSRDSNNRRGSKQRFPHFFILHIECWEMREQFIGSGGRPSLSRQAVPNWVNG
jgi:hypothetical protein